MQEGLDQPENLTERGHSVDDQAGSHDGSLTMPGLLQTVESSPSLAGLDLQGEPLSPADKRRNKLGYHRTAVACGHCRRRKIRCIPAFEDPGGRCQNCIRLKKDCHFFPVDQQAPPPGKRGLSGTKTAEGFLHEGETSAASSSPGGILRSSSYEQMALGESALETPPLSRDSPAFPGFQPGSRSLSTTGFEYANSYDPSQQKAPQLLGHSSYMSNTPRNYPVGPMNAHYYQQYGQPLPGSYSSHFAPDSLPSNAAGVPQPTGLEFSTGAPPNGVYPWVQPPARSMSAGGAEELSHGFPEAYRTHTFPSFERRMTDDLHALPTTGAGFAGMGVAGHQHAMPPQFSDPTTYGTISPEMQQVWAASGQDQASQAAAAAASAYGQVWYPHPSHPYPQGRPKPG